MSDGDHVEEKREVHYGTHPNMTAPFMVYDHRIRSLLYPVRFTIK